MIRVRNTHPRGNALDDIAFGRVGEVDEENPGVVCWLRAGWLAQVGAEHAVDTTKAEAAVSDDAEALRSMLREHEETRARLLERLSALEAENERLGEALESKPAEAVTTVAYHMQPDAEPDAEPDAVDEAGVPTGVKSSRRRRS